MKFWSLIARSSRHLQETGDFKNPSWSIFQEGARWMQQQLNAIRKQSIAFDERVNFTFYGVLKYALSLMAFGIAAYFLFQWNVLLTPLSVLIFYGVEIHFLFLFPLLLDGVKNPVYKGIRILYRLGIFKIWFEVMALGFYMLMGLFRADRWRRWHIGCMAVLIWYEDDVRSRL